MQKTKITAAEAMVKCLELEGIKEIFGYPGAAICPFYDALTHSDIKHVLVRHEANAGHAANGYARISGKPAVAVATSGPGATNLITAIATAYMDSIPVVFITGQVNTDQIGRDVFQEADITGAAEPFVKHSFLVKDAKELPLIFKQAFYIAGSGRQGPVLIDVPADVQKTKIDFEYPETIDIRSYKPRFEGNKLQIKRVAEAVSKAKKPLICVGGGVFAANATDKLISLAEKCQIPVVTTLMGISAIPSEHPLFFGMLGMHGGKPANLAAKNCDLLMLLGARMGDRAATAIRESDDLTVVHVDIDPAEIGKNIGTEIPVVGDLSAILTQLLKACEARESADWIEYLNSHKSSSILEKAPDGFVNPKAFILRLNEFLPKKSVVVADVGQNQMWTAANILLDGGRFLTSGGMGTMGYSVPAAVGAKAADESAEVVAICGDGSFQMQFMELATMIQHGINVKIIVMKNGRLGMVRELQTKNYKNNLTAVFLDGSPDFIKLSEAYGIPAERVTSIGQADDAIKRMISAESPYLLEVDVLCDERTIFC